jgi:hypothetical protein
MSPQRQETETHHDTTATPPHDTAESDKETDKETGEEHDAEKETPAEDQDEEAMSGDECFQDRHGNFWKRGHTVFISWPNMEQRQRRVCLKVAGFHGERWAGYFAVSKKDAETQSPITYRSKANTIYAPEKPLICFLLNHLSRVSYLFLLLVDR